MENETSEDYAGDVETALLDADLFLKYNATERALQRLQDALAHNPRALKLLERARELHLVLKQKAEAARVCLELAGLYIERENLDAAHDRLLEAKNLNPRLNIARGLEAIRHARRPDLAVAATSAVAAPSGGGADKYSGVLAGNLARISLFEVIQVLENSRLTGALVLTDETNPQSEQRLFLNDGNLVGAKTAAAQGLIAFKSIMQTTRGSFDFQLSPTSFPVKIVAPNNTTLLLDTLREMDEARHERAQDEAAPIKP